MTVPKPEASYRRKVDKLTFHDGRQYQAGETITFEGEFANVARKFYGDKPEITPVKEPVTPATQAALATKQALIQNAPAS